MPAQSAFLETIHQKHPSKRTPCRPEIVLVYKKSTQGSFKISCNMLFYMLFSSPQNPGSELFFQLQGAQISWKRALIRGNWHRQEPPGCSNSQSTYKALASRSINAVRQANRFPTRTNWRDVFPHGRKFVLCEVARDLGNFNTWRVNAY